MQVLADPKFHPNKVYYPVSNNATNEAIFKQRNSFEGNSDNLLFK